MGHWYNKDGSPQYTVIGANGKERDSSLRDARKLNLSPSVTTIIQGAAKPGLDNYKAQQLIEACRLNPRTDFEDIESWAKRVIIEAAKHSKDAADAGSKIHDAMENYYLGNNMFRDDYLLSICHPVVSAMDRWFPAVKWEPEKSFTDPLGYGGKVDMSSKHEGGIILDFKTKNTDDASKMVTYDEHVMQLAAYRIGLNLPDAQCYNLFISTQIPGLMVLHKWSEEEVQRGWRMFMHLLCFWRDKNKYNPGVIEGDNGF